ncbi:hypothetical protein BCR44DRAFT_275574 [Catenaria anguillulae PL171]|uniref:Uncharacterized protein n=1 Tax=Catenaria anguillulae PL171 TaxID=765915 RepID=A0A1Y2I4E2_9FUNG|nr:hypothetical protein BCR44DRAFT_275574 [Catenaria anguillulae PL171]
MESVSPMRLAPCTKLTDTLSLVDVASFTKSTQSSSARSRKSTMSAGTCPYVNALSKAQGWRVKSKSSSPCPLKSGLARTGVQFTSSLGTPTVESALVCCTRRQTAVDLATSLGIRRAASRGSRGMVPSVVEVFHCHPTVVRLTYTRTLTPALLYPRTMPTMAQAGTRSRLVVLVALVHGLNAAVLGAGTAVAVTATGLHRQASRRRPVHPSRIANTTTAIDTAPTGNSRLRRRLHVDCLQLRRAVQAAVISFDSLQ